MIWRRPDWFRFWTPIRIHLSLRQLTTGLPTRATCRECCDDWGTYAWRCIDTWRRRERALPRHVRRHFLRARHRDGEIRGRPAARVAHRRVPGWTDLFLCCRRWDRWRGVWVRR